jgi:hypothetical protein
VARIVPVLVLAVVVLGPAIGVVLPATRRRTWDAMGRAFEQD